MAYFAPMRVYFDADADLALMRGKKVAVAGYGNQGRAQALNLRDSLASDVRIALRDGSRSAAGATSEGFEVMAPLHAAAWADILVVLLPDEEQGTFYSRIEAALRPGAALVFAHGFSIHFRLIEPRADLDVLLVAPKGPGTALREEYRAGGGLVSLVAVAQDASGTAEALALSYAAALGSGRIGILPTSFAEECEADLFNEQAVLWATIPELILAGYETLVDAGFSPEVAYLECVSEVKLIADLIHGRGIAGMRQAISNTAEFGALKGGCRIIGQDARTEMRRILREVRSGQFAEDLLAEAKTGYKRLSASRAEAERHPMEEVGARLRALKP